MISPAADFIGTTTLEEERMKKRRILLPALLAGMMILSACAGAGDVNATDTVETFIPQTGATEVMATEAVPTLAATLESTATQAQTATLAATSAATVEPTGVVSTGVPATGGEVEALTEMLRYRVVDNNGNELGRVRDYIVNTCEAHVLYIVMSSSSANGSVLIPYEAVSLNKNRPQNAPADALVVNFDASLLASVPAVDLKTTDLTAPDWDAAVMAFWKQNIPISLTSACNVPSGSQPTLIPTQTGTLVSPTGTAPAATTAPSNTVVAPTDAVPSETPVSGALFNGVAYQATATPPSTVTPGSVVTGTPGATPTSNRVNVYKIALATDLIGANLVDGANNMLGKVRDALVLKSTGATQFFIIQLVAGNQQDANGNMVAVPPGVVNLFYDNSFIRTGSQVTGTPVPATQVPATGVTQTPPAPMSGGPVGGEVVQNASRLERPVLVLLVDLSVLQNAPAYSIVSGMVDQGTFDYWSQFVPMARPTAQPTGQATQQP